jgi:hypothetical protein
MIEEAIGVYSAAPAFSPAQAHDLIREACAIMDMELMRLPLEQAGWPGGGPAPAPYPARIKNEKRSRAFCGPGVFENPKEVKP